MKIAKILICLLVALCFVGSAFAQIDKDVGDQTTIKAAKSYPYQAAAESPVIERIEPVSGGEIAAITAVAVERYSGITIAPVSATVNRIDSACRDVHEQNAAVTENRFTFNKIFENKIRYSKIDYPLKS